MADEGYNGYTNYDTWLLYLNIDNDQGLYEEVDNFVSMQKGQLDTYQLGDAIREHLESLFFVEDCNAIVICDTWTWRNWAEVDWNEVAETRLELD